MGDDKEETSIVSVRSLVDPQMAGRMFVQRGPNLSLYIKIFNFNTYYIEYIDIKYIIYYYIIILSSKMK